MQPRQHNQSSACTNNEQELASQGTSKLNPTGFSRGAAVGVPRPGEAPQNFGMQRCPGPESPSGRVLLLAGAQGPRESTWLAVSFRLQVRVSVLLHGLSAPVPRFPDLAGGAWKVPREAVGASGW